ncbi:hypothetical protein ACOMHN_002580 [Nucella lapillus]
MKCACLILFLVGLHLGRTHDGLQKRGDDPDPLTPIVERLANDVAVLQARLNALDDKVAFSAQFSAANPTVQQYSTFKFDQVNINDGNAYDAQLGIFTAPFPGVYTFSVNGTPAHRMDIDTRGLDASFNGEDSVAMTVVLKLNQGDRVSVANADSDHTFWGSIHTFFNGHLLYPS